MALRSFFLWRVNPGTGIKPKPNRVRDLAAHGLFRFARRMGVRPRPMIAPGNVRVWPGRSIAFAATMLPSTALRRERSGRKGNKDEKASIKGNLEFVVGARSRGVACARSGSAKPNV